MEERILIQPNWQDIIKSNDESFWVQYKSSPAPAINGKLTFKKIIQYSSNDDFEQEEKFIMPQFIADNGFSIHDLAENHRTIKICYEKASSSSDNSLVVVTCRKFVAPVQSFALHKNKNNVLKPVTSLCVTDGGLGVSCSTDGSLLIWLTETGQIRRCLDGHIGDISVCRFFPSGLVVLSGGFDLRLKVWSAEDGSCPVTLVGHERAISDICMVDRGRNIVSVSRDGSCRLWHVGEAKCLATVAKYDCIVNACAIRAVAYEKVKANLPKADQAVSEKEIGTEDKVVACACEDGSLRALALHSRKEVFKAECKSAVNCCCFLDDFVVACGTQDGEIHIYDLLAAQEVRHWREFRSAILSMQPFGGAGGLLVTTADGSCFTWRHSEQHMSSVDMTGADCDPVYQASCNKTHLFTCCRDGLIRKYLLSDLDDEPASSAGAASMSS